MPLFSIIIPAYNRQHLLPATLRSVAAQRFTDYEIIVIDDASTDDTARVAEQFDHVRLIRRPRNGGLCAARNDGLAQAQGEYCALLDSDDLWAPWTLECYHRAAGRFRRPAIINCDGIVGIHQEQNLGQVAETPFSASCFQDYLAYRSHHHQGLLLLTGMAIRTDLLRAVGGFREQFRAFSEDQDLWLRLGTAPGFVRIAQPLCWGYRDHANNVSKDLSRQFVGGQALVHAERNGEYPGGRRRQRQRRKIITLMTRHTARIAFAEHDHLSAGWTLYKDTWTWNLQLGRWKFMAGFPALMAATLAKRQLRRNPWRAQRSPTAPLYP